MATYSKDFIVKNGLQVGGHIMPDDNETYDLGSSSKKFRDLYLSAGTIYLGDIVLKDNGDGSMGTFTSDGVTPASLSSVAAATAVTTTYDNSTSGMSATHVKGALDELMAAVEAIDTAGELAYDNSTSGLAATTVKGAIDEIVAEEDTNVKALLTNLDGNIVPSADITYDLGSPTKQWKDIYVGPGSLYVNGTKVLEDDAGTLKVNADAGQALTVATSGAAALTLSGGNALNLTTTESSSDIALNPTGQIELNGDVVIGAGQALTTSNGSDLTVNTNLALGTNTITAATFFGNLTGNISASSGTTTMNNLVVDGNLTVGGTTTTVNTETINLADNIITLNSNATGSATQNGGIEVERGDDTNVTLRWNETSDKWEVTEDGANYKTIILAGDSITGDTSGNAATATALETPRNIGGVSFNGTANINLPGVNASGNQNTSGNAATATKLAAARTIGLSGDVSGSGSFDGTGNLTITATIADDSHNHTIANVDGLQSALDGKQAAGTYNTIIGTDSDINTSGSTIIDYITVTDGVITAMGTRTLTPGDIGALSTSGKAADANLLDGIDSSSFLRSDTSDNFTTLTGTTLNATTVNSTSDERLKDNVETIADASAKVSALRGVNFDWKATGEKSMGVIAQEVEAVIPEVVATDEEGGKAVNYQAMVGLLIEAVKELQEKVDAHEAKCECGK
jgi:hypothetical protein